MLIQFTKAPPSRRPLALPSLIVTLAAMAAPAPGQVPPGSALIGTYVDAGVPAAVSGLHLVDLSTGGVTPVTGLPGHIQAPGGVLRGVATLALRRSDGGILVGNTAQATTTYIDPFPFCCPYYITDPGYLGVNLLYLNGTAVDHSRTRYVGLGTTATSGGVFVAALPDDRIFVAVSDTGGALNNGPLAGHPYGIIDFSGPTPIVTPIANPALMPVAGNYGGGIAVDPTGRYVYFPVTVNIPSPNRNLQLHRIDLTTSQSCVLTNWPGQFASGIAVDDDGSVYLSATDLAATTHYVHKVQVNGCGVATVSSTQSSTAIAANGLALDRATGNFIADSGFAPGFPTPIGGIYAIAANGAATWLTTFTGSAQGKIARQGIAVGNAIDGYGAPSDGLSHHWFENFPNPGGKPTLGNLGFSLTLRSDPLVPTLSLLAISTGRGSLSIAGIDVLVDPGTAFTTGLPAAATQAFAVPIPANAALHGALLTAQSIHLEATGSLAASAGIAVTIQ